VEWFLPPALRTASPDVVRRAKLCIAYNLTVPLWAFAFGLLLWSLGQPLIGGIVFAATFLTPLPFWVLHRTGSLVLTGNVIAFFMSLGTISCTWLEGGLGAPGVLWFPLVPILAMLIAGRPTGIAWTAIHVLALVGFYLLDRAGDVPVLGMDTDTVAFLHMALGASATIVAFLLASLFESLKVDALGHLEAANRALALARDQAEAATRAKSDFLATMSHEIRTPIHGIFGMTEMALDTIDDSERREFLHRTRACADTLLVIINDVLDFSRIEAGKVELEQVEFDPQALVDGVLDTLAVQANGRGLELLARVDERVPARLRGDAGRLRQILLNLVGNAVKFTEQGAVLVSLEPHGADSSSGFVLRGTVRDTGIGVPEDKQASIFEAFTQVAGWSTNPHGGTGLGLAITRRLVGLMDGHMWLDSRPGEGSTFGFTARLEALAPPAACAPIGDGRARVLVVDRNAVSRDHVARLLGAHGIRTVAVTAVTEAHALMEREVFDATVLNVAGDPFEIDGLVAELGAPASGRRVPLVALVTRMRALADPAKLGLAACIPKPIKRATLVAVLAKVLRESGAGDLASPAVAAHRGPAA
jgi:signal transduction histidine kinase